MRRNQVNKYCGKTIAITFKCCWFNEAVQSWVNDDTEYRGVLVHCPHKTQERFYQLDCLEWSPTDHACWSANSIKKIRVIEEEEE